MIFRAGPSFLRPDSLRQAFNLSTLGGIWVERKAMAYRTMAGRCGLLLQAPVQSGEERLESDEQETPRSDPSRRPSPERRSF